MKRYAVSQIRVNPDSFDRDVIWRVVHGFYELAWASVKGYVAKHNKDFNLKETEKLIPDPFKHTTTDMWRQFCRHVIDIENKDAVEEMIIEIGGDEDESDDEDSEDDMMDDHDRQLIDIVLQQSTCTDTQLTPTRLTDTQSTSTN